VVDAIGGSAVDNFTASVVSNENQLARQPQLIAHNQTLMPYASNAVDYKLIVVNPTKSVPMESLGTAARAFLRPSDGHRRRSGIRPAILIWLGLTTIFLALPTQLLAQQRSFSSLIDRSVSIAPGISAFSGRQQSAQQMPGTISGTVLDPTGAAIAGALVTLRRGDQSLAKNTQSDNDGQFSFDNVSPGPFTVAIASPGFAAQSSSGALQPGEIFVVPPVKLAIATEVTEVRVSPSLVEMAEEEIKIEEKQRVLGFIPNFYVTYIPNAAPLNTKQKFQLAWRSTIDPVTFLLIGGTAGVQQAVNDFSGFGQGAQGYGKRYGAAYANLVTGTYIGSAILPSILKQDPRYFYKGTGTARERVLYAMANAVICKGDNGRWQPNYSGILGSLAAGGISNTYYPSQNRDGLTLTFENTLIGIGTTAAINVIQEFVIPKLTPNLPIRQVAKP
jgi:Carboxypeptidase regulatory-like domain